MNGPLTPLSAQLVWAARTVAAVVQGRSLSDAMPKVPAPLRPGVQALVFHALRHWGWARAVVARLAEQEPSPAVQALLGVALTLLPRGESPAVAEGAPAYAPHTVVDQAVAALPQVEGPRAPTGFVNACLRRYLREAGALDAELAADAEVRWNHPFWWVKRLRKDHPLHWQQVLQANNQAAPMALRVNLRRNSLQAYLDRLVAQGLSARVAGPAALVLDHPVPVDVLPGWAEGCCSVQDLAAQQAAPLLLSHLAARGAGPGRVLDACAAPGGKTAHLLEAGDAPVWALEQDPVRAQRIHQGLARLGLRAEVRVADAGDTAAWWDGQPFDGVLLDAPCTASGIVRRHPDVRWLRRPTDVDQLAAQQRRLLDALWPVLAPGGCLVYCTCSVFKAEGDDQVAAFVARQSNARLLAAPGHLLPGVAPGSGLDDNRASEHDGFFYAVLEKALA